jgi:uncharacterized protein involved in exopolysaccharide biosynthesis
MNLLGDFSSLVGIVRDRLGLAVTVFAVVLGLGLAAIFLLPARYTSSMRILIRATPTDLRSAPDRANGAQVGQVTEEEVNSEVELLTSYDLIKQAVLHNHLEGDESGSDSEQEKVDIAIRRMGDKLNVSAIRKTNIIEVAYTAKSPKLAADVLRSIESGYMETHLQAQSTPGGFRFFRDETDYYRNQFARRQGALAQFNASQGTANLEQQMTLLTRTIADQEASLQQVEAQITELHMEVGESTSVTKSLSPRIDTTKRSVPRLASIEHLTTLLADLKSRRIQQASKFRDDDPLLKETDNEIAAVESELQDSTTAISYETSTDVNPISQSIQSGMATRSVELAGLEAKAGVLKSQIANNRSRINYFVANTGQYRLLSGDVQNAEDDYNNYVQRQENARISESLDASKISNVVMAQEPTESILPNPRHRALIFVFSFLMGIFLSVGSCLLLGQRQPNLTIQVTS